MEGQRRNARTVGVGIVWEEGEVEPELVPQRGVPSEGDHLLGDPHGVLVPVRVAALWRQQRRGYLGEIRDSLAAREPREARAEAARDLGRVRPPGRASARGGGREEGSEALEAVRERAGELGEVLADAARRGGGRGAWGGGGSRTDTGGFVLLGGEEGVGDGAREPRHCRRRGRRRRCERGETSGGGKVGWAPCAPFHCRVGLAGWGVYFDRQECR